MHAWHVCNEVHIDQQANIVMDDGMCSFESGELLEYRFCLSCMVSGGGKSKRKGTGLCKIGSLRLDILSLRLFEPISHGFKRKRSQAVLGTGLVYSF